MRRVKRAKYIQVSFESRSAVDVSRLLRGDISICQRDQAIARFLHFKDEYVLSAEDLVTLEGAPSEVWCEADRLAQECGVDFSVIEGLIRCGLLIEENEAANEIMKTQDKLSSIAWNRSAFYFHFSTKLCKNSNVTTPLADKESLQRQAEGSASRFAEHIVEHGEPPHHFHSVTPPSERIALDNGEHESAFTHLLLQRCTTRLFDTDQILEKQQLNTLLHLTFGSQGSLALSDGLIALKKTSPSGGAMHPIEVYPLVISVEGLATGLYHYHVGDHALEPMRQMGEYEARSFATELTAGQSYYSTAHVIFLYTARFQRNFWKYRQHPAAYKVLLMDMAHLSQSLYLLCADMGLGAFFTAACNQGSIEDLLGIDGIEEGALAVSGCGIVPKNDDALKFIPIADDMPPRDSASGGVARDT